MHNEEKPRPIPRGDPIPKGERENVKENHSAQREED